MYVEIEVIGREKLTRVYWRIFVRAENELKLEIDRYEEQTRPTRRHKWRPERAYARLSSEQRSLRLSTVEVLALPPEWTDWLRLKTFEKLGESAVFVPPREWR